MDILLSPVEVRILGSLIEKELATPQYYPLSLNSLTNACNQKSNRDPLMALDEHTVEKAVDRIRNTKLVWRVSTMGNRVSKYEHNICQIKDFTLQEKSVLCELFLRGPQTVGELRTHAGRFCELGTLEEVEALLQGLIDDTEKGPFVQKLPREMGRRENRYAHLFCGEVVIDSESREPVDTYTVTVHDEIKRIEALEAEIADLKSELVGLKEKFEIFRKQFE